MIDLVVVILALLILLALDLVAIACRASFAYLTLARLLAFHHPDEKRLNLATGLLSSITRLRASLNLVLVATRFSLAGVVVVFIFFRPVAMPVLAVSIALLVAALLTFWLEWLVERIVMRNAEAWALRLAPFGRALMIFTSFLLLPLALSGDHQSLADASLMVTENDLKTLVDAGQQEGVFESGERRMIYSIFELGETLAREIMVPRIDMLALDVTTPLAQAVDALIASGYSRVPVYEETVDRCLGLIYAKDLLRVWRSGDELASLHSLLRPAYFIPEAKKVDELLAEMQARRIHMAIVVDEYGGVAGLVTFEDIIEEVLGEIQDEYDQAEELPYQALPGGAFSFLGKVALDDFNEIMGSNLSSDEADTLAGFIYSRIGRVPNVGESVQEGDLLLTVEQVSARRIRRVNARWDSQDLEQKEKGHVNG